MPRTFRQGARQPLSALDRTLNGHVAGLMPHEYNRHHSQRGNAHGGYEQRGGWQKAAGRTIGGVKNSLSQQRERSRKSRQPASSNARQSGVGGGVCSVSSNSNRVHILDEDETPRTARAESLLPNLKAKAGKGSGKGLRKKRSSHGSSSSSASGDGPSKQRITAADVQKENYANREHGPSSVALEAARLRQSRTPVKGQDAPDWHDDEEGSKYDEHDESGVDLEVDATRDEEERGARNAHQQRYHEGKVPGTPPAVSRAPVKTGKNARLQGGYHVATPTRMHFGPSETETEGKHQDSSSAAKNKERSRRRRRSSSSSSSSSTEQGLLTPAAAVRVSQRNKAMRAKQLSDLGIEIDEGKYDEDSARMKVRDSSSGSGSVSTPVRRPATSPLRSSGKRRSRRHGDRSNQDADGGSDRAPDTQRSPEPETARASQFVSERSPAAAMARLRRMKQERRTRSSSKQQRGSALKPKTPTQQKPKGEEVHHHHHHYFQQGPQGEYYEQHYDENGYDQYGYDQYGYDQYGYDQQGYDQHGYSKQQNDEYHQQHHHEHYEMNHHGPTSSEGKHADEDKVGEGGGGHADGDGSGADGITKRIRAGFDIVFSRARHGRFDEVRTALDSGMGVNTRDKHGNTLLHIACQNGNKRLLKMLLRSHAAIDASNQNGNTGLHFCFMYAYYGLGEYLISKGANDMIRNELGQTCYEADR